MNIGFQELAPKNAKLRMPDNVGILQMHNIQCCLNDMRESIAPIWGTSGSCGLYYGIVNKIRGKISAVFIFAQQGEVFSEEILESNYFCISEACPLLHYRIIMGKERGECCHGNNFH